MTMVLFTAVAIVREKERGNSGAVDQYANQDAGADAGQDLPLHPDRLDSVGAECWGWAGTFFQVPIRGSLIHVLAAASVFIAANLSLGLLSLDCRSDPVSGDADGLLHLVALYSDLGLYVSLSMACQQPLRISRRFCRSPISID